MTRHALLLVLAALAVPIPGHGVQARQTRADPRTRTTTETRPDGGTVSTLGTEAAGHRGPMTDAPVSSLSNTPSPSAAAVGELGTTAGAGSTGASTSVGSSAGGTDSIGLGGIGPGGLAGGPGTDGQGGGPAGGASVGPNLNTR